MAYVKDTCAKDTFFRPGAGDHTRKWGQELLAKLEPLRAGDFCIRIFEVSSAIALKRTSQVSIGYDCGGVLQM